MSLFERRVLAALAVLFVLLLSATLLLHHQKTVHLRVVHPGVSDAR